MVVTHAMSSPVRMTIPQMQEAAKLGAYIEFVYSALLGPNGLKIEDYVACDRERWAQHPAFLRAIWGNRETRCIPDGLAAFFQALRKEGLSAS